MFLIAGRWAAGIYDHYGYDPYHPHHHQYWDGRRWRKFFPLYMIDSSYLYCLGD
jgi:hypothetical protein